MEPNLFIVLWMHALNLNLKLLVIKLNVNSKEIFSLPFEQPKLISLVEL